MLGALNVIATNARWLKPVIKLASLASLSAFLYVVFLAEGANRDVYLIPSVVALIWTLLLYILLATFPNVPAAPDKSRNLFFRIRLRVVRLFYHILAVLFLLFTIAVVILSLRILNVWRIDF